MSVKLGEMVWDYLLMTLQSAQQLSQQFVLVLSKHAHVCACVKVEDKMGWVC